MRKGNINAVEFDEIVHRYFYNGHELKGVTRIIGERLGKTFPDSAVVKVACSYGSQVHKEVENWINTGAEPVMQKSTEVVQTVKNFLAEHGNNGRLYAERRVSDFETTASNVDIVLDTPVGVHLFDIKTGAFDREYCTLQLNAYRVMYENSYEGSKVVGLHVICTKTGRLYEIVNRDDDSILAMLKENAK
jgi:hypothetical protein